MLGLVFGNLIFSQGSQTSTQTEYRTMETVLWQFYGKKWIHNYFAVLPDIPKQKLSNVSNKLRGTGMVKGGYCLH